MELLFGAHVVAQKPHLFPTWGRGRSPEGSRASSTPTSPRPTSPRGERSRSRSNSREVAEGGKRAQGELRFIVPDALRREVGEAERAAQKNFLSPARTIPRSRLSGTPRGAARCDSGGAAAVADHSWGRDTSAHRSHARALGGLAMALAGPGARLAANDEAIAQRDTVARATPFAMRQCNHCSGLCFNPVDFNGLGIFCSGECAISFDTDRAREIAALKWAEREEFTQRSRAPTLTHDEIETVDWCTASGRLAHSVGQYSETGRTPPIPVTVPPQLERSAVKVRRPSGGGPRRSSAERDLISAHFG